MNRIYLDDAGSAPVLPEVAEAVRGVPAGNPSSPHAEGRAARAALDLARDRAAEAIGATRLEVTFFSSGTEAVNLAIFGTRGRLVTWAAEHQSVIAAARASRSERGAVVIGDVDRAAMVGAGALTRGKPVVSLRLAN